MHTMCGFSYSKFSIPCHDGLYELLLQCYWLHDLLHVTLAQKHMLVVIRDKSNMRKKIQGRGAILSYTAMLHYVQMKLKGLLLVLANKVSGYMMY
jgi:hypothetical protein